MDEGVAVLRNELTRRGIIKGVGKKAPDGSYSRYQLVRKVAFMPTPGGAGSVQVPVTETIKEVKEAAEKSVLRAGLTEDQIGKMVKSLNRRLRKRGLEKVALYIKDSWEGMQGEYVSDPNLNRFIILALDAVPENIQGNPKKIGEFLAGVLDHESIHALVELGLFLKRI